MMTKKRWRERQAASRAITSTAKRRQHPDDRLRLLLDGDRDEGPGRPAMGAEESVQQPR
jgi:hypothetical protein